MEPLGRCRKSGLKGRAFRVPWSLRRLLSFIVELFFGWPFCFQGSPAKVRHAPLLPPSQGKRKTVEVVWSLLVLPWAFLTFLAMIPMVYGLLRFFLTPPLLLLLLEFWIA